MMENIDLDCERTPGGHLGLGQSTAALARLQSLATSTTATPTSDPGSRFSFFKLKPRAIFSLVAILGYCRPCARYQASATVASFHGGHAVSIHRSGNPLDYASNHGGRQLGVGSYGPLFSIYNWSGRAINPASSIFAGTFCEGHGVSTSTTMLPVCHKC